MRNDDPTEALRSQGVNPETIFTDLYPAIYALTFLDEGYERQSEICAALASAQCGGLWGKHVLDLGCGYGTTTMAIAPYNPHAINAVDNSSAMVEFMRTILKSHIDLDEWLRAKGAHEVLSTLGFYEPLLKHLRFMRETHQEGIFHTLQHGRLNISHADILIEPWKLVLESDVAIANNVFHWPVNQRIDVLMRDRVKSRAELVPQAVADTLEKISEGLKRRGAFVLMEPSDFITCDDQPAFETYLEENGMHAHPAFKRVQGLVNEILRRDYGVERSIPTRTTLFKWSELSEMFAAGGFKIVNIHYHEAAYVNDPLEIYLSRLPMQIGSLKISFADKMRVLREVREQLTGALTPEERKITRTQWFFLVCEKM